MLPKAFLTHKKQDYSTPWEVVQSIEDAIDMKCSLDVCATEISAKAPEFYTEERDAFLQNWSNDTKGGFAFCNPPYSGGLPEKFLVKAMMEKLCGVTTVLLLPANKVDQPWWHKLVIPKHAIWTVRGRINFLDPETGEVPKIFVQSNDEVEGVGKWVRQTNPQASLIVIVGPGFGPCSAKSFTVSRY